MAMTKKQKRAKTIKEKAGYIKSAKKIVSILTIIAFVYSGAIVYSVTKVNFNPANISGNYTYNDNGTPAPTYSDDSLAVSVDFVVGNDGYFKLHNITLKIDIVVPSCTGLPDNTTIGSKIITYDDLLGGQNLTDTIIIDMTTNITILTALLIENPITRADLRISTRFGMYPVEIWMSFNL